jgi:hypothetical protein
MVHPLPSLREFLANLCLLGEVVDFLLQVPGTPRIRASLNHRVIADFAVANAVGDLVLMLCATPAQGPGLAQKLARRLSNSLTQEAGMPTACFGDL